MGETATLAEIKKKYDGEWILIVDPVTAKNLEIVKGKAMCRFVFW